jgi:hypothetical protein
MIHYQLRCDTDHAFDGWFKDSASFDRQCEMGLIACPLCNSVTVSRALMAPALGRGRRDTRNIPVADDTAQAPTPMASNRAVPAITAPPPGAMAAKDLPDQLQSLLHRLRSEVEKTCDYVGKDFAEEARRIHYGESKARGIYGETTAAEAEALADEGVEFGVMPWLRRSDN